MTTQQDVREWWNRNPMSYDVDDPIPYEEDSQEYFREIDRRIFHPRYMRLTADASGKPSRSSSTSTGSAARTCSTSGSGAGSRRRCSPRAEAKVTGVDLPLGRRDDAPRLDAFGLQGGRAPGGRRAASVRRCELRPRVLVGRDPPLEQHGPRAVRARARDAARRAARADGLPPPLAFLRRLRASSGSCRWRVGFGLHFEGARAGETKG